MKNVTSLVVIVFVLFSAPLLYAHRQCPKSGSGSEYKSKSGYHHGQKEYQCPVTAKFMKKAHMILKNREELGLSDEQADTIHALKVGVKKAYIRQKADMDILMIDVKTKMRERKVDVEGINALIDENFAALAKSSKETIEAYAKLKATLTDEQMDKLKQVWMKSNK